MLFKSCNEGAELDDWTLRGTYWTWRFDTESTWTYRVSYDLGANSKMKTRRETWTVVLIALLFAIFIGLSITGFIVRREGVDGLFRRKRAVVQKVMPRALPLHDKFENEVKDRLPDGTFLKAVSGEG